MNRSKDSKLNKALISLGLQLKIYQSMVKIDNYESVMKWQLEQLLKNSRVSYEHQSDLESLLWSLRDTLVSSESSPSSEATGMRIVGSYMVRTCYKLSEKLNIDVALEMPASLFEAKDYLNCVYLEKKLGFLNRISAVIKEKLGLAAVTLGYLNGNKWSPILEFTHAQSGFTVKLIPSLPLDVFAAHRLSPLRNSIRPHSLIGALESISDSSQLPSTAQYNTSVLSDMQISAHLNYVYKSINDSPAIQDCIVLLKVWLSRCGFNGHGNFIAMLVSWLVNQRKLSAQWDSLLLFRTVVQWISANDLSKTPVSMATSAVDLTEFKKAFDVVLVDPSGTVNLLSLWTRGEYKHLMQEAKRTMGLLKDSASTLKVGDNFDAVFLRKRAVVFDNLAVFQVPAEFHDRDFSFDKLKSALHAKSSLVCSGVTTSDVLNHGSIADALRFKISSVLEQALTTRINFVTVEIVNGQVSVGVSLSPSESCRQIDMGPLNEDTAALKKFRHLWGEKAELRRFADGTVVESVVWELPDNAGYDARSGIVQMAVEYLMQRHFKLKCGEYTGNHLFQYIRPHSELVSSDPRFQQKLNTFSHVLKSFDSFTRQVKDLQLPLHIIDVRPCHPALAYSSMMIPQPRKPFFMPKTSNVLPPYHECFEVLLYLESSNRWPTEIEPIQLTKQSFYCAMVRGIEELGAGYSAHVNISGFVEITTPEGFSYRCRIAHPYEKVVLESKISSPDIEAEEKKQMKRLLYEYNMEYIWRPAHYAKVQAMVHKYQALSATIRLAKRWFSARLMSEFSDEFIELLCIRVFTANKEYAPATPYVGFIDLLEMLVAWNWTEEPIAVEMTDETMTEQRIFKVKKDFDLLRKQDPGMQSRAGYVSPIGLLPDEQADQGSIWSENISKVWMIRLQMQAKSALKTGNLCKSSLKPFDVILHLRPEVCTRSFESYNPPRKDTKFEEQFKNLTGEPIVGLDPVSRYLSDLKQVFGDAAVFFHDKYGGSVIAVAFNPLVLNAAWPFRASVKYPFAVIDNETQKRPQCRINVQECIVQMAQMGDQIVERIDIQTQFK